MNFHLWILISERSFLNVHLWIFHGSFLNFYYPNPPRQIVVGRRLGLSYSLADSIQTQFRFYSRLLKQTIRWIQFTELNLAGKLWWKMQTRTPEWITRRSQSEPVDWKSKLRGRSWVRSRMRKADWEVEREVDREVGRKDFVCHQKHT